LTIAFFADHVENASNRERIAEAALSLGGSTTSTLTPPIIAVENARGASSVYGRRPLRGAVTLAVGNERRGLSASTLAVASEIVAIPTASRAVNTLNVAAAAAVAGWYVLHGSGPQPRTSRPSERRPAVLLVGDDPVEIGSSLRTAAALGFRD